MSIDYSKRTFLVVDDFEKFRAVVKGVIQLCGGKTIDLANNGSEAIIKIKNQAYDVILCDYHLGQGKNGQQILEQLRFENLLKPTSVFLMVTAESGSEMVMSAIECQPDGYLMKPFNQAMLQSRLDKIMKMKLELSPIYEAMERHEMQEAIKHCQAISNKSPKYTSQCKRIEAELYLKTEQYDKAKMIYETVLSVRPLPWASLGLGQIYYYLEDYHQAIAVLVKLIKKNKMLLQAYDWLAKAQLQLGDEVEAEQTLKRAIELSPQAIQRQMELGEIAYNNGDYEVAEQSYRAAVKLGRNSCYKSPKNYTNLARTLMPKLESDNDSVRKRASDETFSVLNEVRGDYKDDKAISLEATLIESQSLKILREDEKARKTIELASALYETYGSQLNPHVKIDMAQTLQSLGLDEEADEIATNLAAEYADSPEIMEQISKFIDTSPLNAEGIVLYRKGEYIEAIDKFEEACEEYPASISINLNAIQAIARFIQENGVDEKMLKLCDAHFERISSIESSDKRYHRFRELKKLVQSLTAS